MSHDRLLETLSSMVSKTLHSPESRPHPYPMTLVPSPGVVLCHSTPGRVVAALLCCPMQLKTTRLHLQGTRLCIISAIIILAGATALIIGFGISGRHSITVTTLTSAGNTGEDGILSCTFEPDIKLSDIMIQWLKESVMGLAHEFKEGKDDLSDQHEMFRGQTAVFADQVVIVGNASLRLKNVQLTDAGTCKCYIITSKGKGNANLEYKTGAFSIPEANVDCNATSESLRCEAPRWFPQPTVVWASQVDQGANFSEVSDTSFELNSKNVTMKVVSVLYNVTINNTYSCMIENNIAKATGDIKVTDSENKRRSHLQLLNSKASLCVSSVAITWVLLPLCPYLMLK
ncbi:LOW QUALITY PROTEIN: V-set domain-containing T-cell activation inhibitor 1 [Phocoena sinus]|uniref:LOW QUALITY PROTEIN: V-set domain-containing T-cell activation inhibitor 1 n=1 Tax=Phocoena sinus TaxID=42100 RepID=UPI0013C51496|nr:LOW QUALITY PROTEIN: V-set domain-containing T-cell activation inhibitor 1 [Phocoena sinus]